MVERTGPSTSSAQRGVSCHVMSLLLILIAFWGGRERSFSRLELQAVCCCFFRRVGIWGTWSPFPLLGCIAISNETLGQEGCVYAIFLVLTWFELRGQSVRCRFYAARNVKGRRRSRLTSPSMYPSPFCTNRCCTRLLVFRRQFMWYLLLCLSLVPVKGRSYTQAGKPYA